MKIEIGDITIDNEYNTDGSILTATDATGNAVMDECGASSWESLGDVIQLWFDRNF